MNYKNIASLVAVGLGIATSSVAWCDQAKEKVATRDKPIVIQLKGAKGKIVPMEFMACPAGTFEMGCDGDPKSPCYRHEVTLTRKFWIGKFQVTRAQWATVNQMAPMNEKVVLVGGGASPITSVTTKQVLEFCDVLMRRYCSKIKNFPKGYVIRLPTEAEWEYALRANCEDESDPYFRLLNGDKNKEILKEIAVDRAGRREFVFKNGGKRDIENFSGPYIKVGTKKPNAWGLYDMVGNGCELTMDTVDQEDWVPLWDMANEAKNMSPSFKYDDTEKDPLRISPELDAACSIVRNMENGNPWSVSPYGKTRVKYEKGSCATFRLVIGPDLIKERNKDKVKKSAAGKKRSSKKK